VLSKRMFADVGRGEKHLRSLERSSDLIDDHESASMISYSNQFRQSSRGLFVDFDQSVEVKSIENASR
jgi:hypothetical protein